MGKPLAPLVLDKLREQTDVLERLIALLPGDKLSWRPELTDSNIEALSISQLLGHLLDCLAGFCAALYSVDRERLAHFARLRELAVNHDCGPEEAVRRIREYLAHIEQGFALLSDADLGQAVPTVFVSDGEALLTILLGNLEHLINHKYQLFFYLKMLGVPVETADLYSLRG